MKIDFMNLLNWNGYVLPTPSVAQLNYYHLHDNHHANHLTLQQHSCLHKNTTLKHKTK